jgi:hypothetical protein
VSFPELRGIGGMGASAYSSYISSRDTTPANAIRTPRRPAV